MCLSEHSRALHSTPRSAEMDGQRLQGLIDGNKRWLEMRKKDTSMYPSITLTHSPSSSSPLFHITSFLNFYFANISSLSSPWVVPAIFNSTVQTAVHPLSGSLLKERAGPAGPGWQQSDQSLSLLTTWCTASLYRDRYRGLCITDCDTSALWCLHSSFFFF